MTTEHSSEIGERWFADVDPDIAEDIIEQGYRLAADTLRCAKVVPREFLKGQ
jgi:hypothetical protein